MQMNARSQATVCFLFMPLPSLWWMYPVKYFSIMHTILFWTETISLWLFVELSSNICFLHGSFLLPWVVIPPLFILFYTVYCFLSLFLSSFPPSVLSRHPYHPLCLPLTVSLASLSPSQLDSCGTDWAWGSSPHQRRSVVECEQATEAPISHWLMSHPFSLFLPPPPPPLPHSPATAPLQSPPVPSLFPPPSHFTYHFSQSSTLLLLQPICCSYGFLSILSFICISAFQHPRLPLCLVPQSLHSPSATVPLQAQLQTEAGVCLSVSDSPPPPFPLPPFLTTTSTITAPMIHTLPRSLAADPVFNHCKHSSTSQPHCCKCTYATCMQMQKLNTGGQLASCHMQTHAHIGIVLLKDIWIIYHFLCLKVEKQEKYHNNLHQCSNIWSDSRW